MDSYFALTVKEALSTFTEVTACIGRLNMLQLQEDLDLSPSSDDETLPDKNTEAIPQQPPIIITGSWDIIT